MHSSDQIKRCTTYSYVVPIVYLLLIYPYTERFEVATTHERVGDRSSGGRARGGERCRVECGRACTASCGTEGPDYQSFD